MCIAYRKFSVRKTFETVAWRTMAILYKLRCVNHLRVKFFKGNKNIHLHFMSSLHPYMPLIFEILPHVRQGLSYLHRNIMIVDVVTTQGAARESATMIFIMLKGLVKG